MSSRLSNLARSWQVWAGVAAVLAFIFLAYQNISLRKSYDSLARQSHITGHSPAGSKGSDGYRAGAVKNTILKQGNAFSACYKKFLTRNPKRATGKIKLDWQINDSGRVKLPGVVTSDFADADFHTCLSGVLSGLEFPPPPQDGYYVEHTLTFEKK